MSAVATRSGLMTSVLTFFGSFEFTLASAGVAGPPIMPVVGGGTAPTHPHGDAPARGEAK